MSQNIEIWDTNIQKIFPNALVETIDVLLDNINEERENFIIYNINNILYLIINNFKSDDAEIRNEYIKSLDALTKVLSEKASFNISLEKILIDQVTGLGAFGQNNASRRYCVFACVCLLRV